MKKLMFAVAACAAMVAFAEDETLQQAANDPQIVQEAADDPAGAQIIIGDDGEMKIIAVGVGTYDFLDEDEFLDARNEAERNAKEHLVKFMQSSFSTETTAENASKKAKSLSKNGGATNKAVSKEQIKTTVNVVKEGASKILAGVIVLKEEKIPSKTDDESGTYRVTIGVSPLSLAAATKISNDMSQSVHDQNNYQPKQGGSTGSGVGGSNGGSQKKGVNEYKVRRSRSAF